MRRKHRIVLLAGMIALAPVLSACADFDLDQLDVFHLSDKKKLPGERQELFPGGVPGVSQGIPPEYLKGNQQQADTALAPGVAASSPAGAPPVAGAPPAGSAPVAAAPVAKTAAIEPAAEPKPKPKRKPKPHTAKKPAGNVTVQPVAQSQGGDEQKLEPWPATPPPPPQPATPQGLEPWPSAPAPSAPAH